MRNRLTSKTLLAETKADGCFSGEIGNPERSKFYHDRYEYDNYDFKKGWDLPDDMDIDDKRDEVGYGIPRKVARALVARKAVALASLTLGANATDKDVTAQARDFLHMGYGRICAAISRIQATEECPECEDKKDEKPAEAPAEAPVEAPAAAPAEAPVACGGTPAEKPAAAAPVPAETPAAPAAPVSAEKPAEAPVEKPVEAPAAPMAAEPAPEPAEPAEAPAENVDDLAAGDDPDAEPEMTIEFPPEDKPMGAEIFNGDTQLDQAAPDGAIESMFRQNSGLPGDEEATPAPQPVQASRKVGLKHMAGQPRLASSDTDEVSMLATLWRGQRNPRI